MALMAAIAPGATASAGAAQTVSAADVPSVSAALIAAGYRTATRTDEDGATYLLVEEGGDEFSVSFDECEDHLATTGCKILVFNTSWELSDDTDNDVANAFNQQATLAHAFVDEEGLLNLSLAVTTEGGLPADNFADVIARWQAADNALAALVDADAPAAPGTVVAALRLP
jgi:hypothetical protein